jgi:tRNA-dihydrouridine synthase B
MAPLSGYTDLPYRRSLRRHGCRYAFTEMIDAASLAHAADRQSPLLRRGGDEGFLGVQLVGSDPEWLKISIDAVNEHDFDVLDFNLGCPVAKVAKKGAGAALGRNIDRALALFALFRERSRHPISAKIRILSETDPAPTLELVRGLAGLGARAVTIHGRVKEAFYSGVVHYELIRLAAAAVPIQIVGNGGIMGLESYARMREASGCRAVMLARGAMGNPWLFRELAGGDAYVPPALAEFLAEVELHVGEMVEFYGEAAAMKMARKIVHDYFRGRGFAGEFRAQASHLATFDDLRRMLAAAPAHFHPISRPADRRLRAD